jgi:alpha-D-ribose 1-methylphosphonate 5-triphosphate synthase subunit PhnI
MILSIREFRILGRRRVIADPATVDREARALALKDDIGDVVRVGIKLGRIMLDLVVSVRRVKRADNALSASSSVRNRLKRYGST